MRMRWGALMALAMLAACSRPVAEVPRIDGDRQRAEADLQLRLAAERGLAGLSAPPAMPGSADGITRLQRLHAIGARVLEANAPLCGRRLRHDLGVVPMNRSDSPFAADFLRHFENDPAVVVLADTGPAGPDRPRPGDRLLAVDGEPVPTGRDTLPQVQALLKRAAATGRPVVLSLRRDDAPLELRLTPRLRCDYDVLLDRAGMVNAFADGRSVRFTTGMVDFAGDDELGLIFGHELGHNAMEHMDKREENARAGSTLGAVLDLLTGAEHLGGYWADVARGAYGRDFEAEADYVGAYYAARAGFDVAAAAGVWRRLGAANPRTITMSTSHPTNPARFVALESAAREIDAKRRTGAELRPEIRLR
ncbi:M48 family metalloprotease [Azospirillum sp.]|uniref:M48 family metallopeptidase n=1 Tax=Azospirillum sp. TaxID=34012 RepID=UPI003D742B51